MRIPDHKSYEEKLVMKPDGVHDDLEELGLLVLTLGSLIIWVTIGLAVYVTYLHV